jgi:hypothetical protein
MPSPIFYLQISNKKASKLENSILDMDTYLQEYKSYENKVVYNFGLGSGGIADCIKFFMFLLEECMKQKKQLYYKKYNIELENYIKLKHDALYIDDDGIKALDCVEEIHPHMCYSTVHCNYSININEVFTFSDEVIRNSNLLFPEPIQGYISLHVRLGDKFLETDVNFIYCIDDKRDFSEEKIESFLKENHTKPIFFCSDNKAYKLRMKEKYNISITNCDIGHTSLSNTTSKQILDAVTEFYILTHSEKIYSGSRSGFSLLASKFNSIPFIDLQA